MKRMPFKSDFVQQDWVPNSKKEKKKERKSILRKGAWLSPAAKKQKAGIKFYFCVRDQNLSWTERLNITKTF